MPVDPKIGTERQEIIAVRRECRRQRIIPEPRMHTASRWRMMRHHHGFPGKGFTKLHFDEFSGLVVPSDRLRRTELKRVFEIGLYLNEVVHRAPRIGRMRDRISEELKIRPEGGANESDLLAAEG